MYVIIFLPLHFFFFFDRIIHICSILIPLVTSDRIFIYQDDLWLGTPLFHFRERFPFIKSMGILDEETGGGMGFEKKGLAIVEVSALANKKLSQNIWFE